MFMRAAAGHSRKVRTTLRTQRRWLSDNLRYSARSRASYGERADSGGAACPVRQSKEVRKKSAR